jgi:hypothetical protein
MKTTSDGRQHQNMKSGISQQPVLGFSSNFKHKFRGPNQNKIWLEMKTTSNVRRPQNIKSEISFKNYSGQIWPTMQNHRFINGKRTTH